jgi:hypothetical protein
MKFHVDLWEGKALYTEEEYKKMEDAFEEMRLDWIDAIFDCDTKKECEAWINAISKKENSWIFEPDRLREKILESAGLTMRYK